MNSFWNGAMGGALTMCGLFIILSALCALKVTIKTRVWFTQDEEVRLKLAGEIHEAAGAACAFLECAAFAAVVAFLVKMIFG